MKVAVVGSREFADERLVRKFVQKLPERATVVSGGARGVDSWAEDQADLRNMELEIYKPDWDEHGNSAGFIRNQAIVENCDMVVAFWDGQSKGTKHTIDLAIENKVPMDIHVRYE